MKPWLLGFSLAASRGWLLYPGLAAAWTEADMQGARALLQGKLEQRTQFPLAWNGRTAGAPSPEERRVVGVRSVTCAAKEAPSRPR